MGTGTLIQVVFDIFLALGFFVILMRMSRAPKDDPRLSRGLQLLQSKIAVLEDLSDRSEVQVNQMIALLEQKAREVQAKIQLAEQQVNAIRVSMDRSLEVAKIFQDKIPHHEIIERQNTLKYVQAARLAHQGMSVDEISQSIDLPKGEIEFITKVNKDQLMFEEDCLPWWARDNAQNEKLGEESEDNKSQVDQTRGKAFTEGEPVGDMASEARLNDVQKNGIQGGTSIEDQAQRLRVEMEIAEGQRLVENLKRLQFEMQNLDFQLAKESSQRDYSSAFETPSIPRDSLAKLGAEFRKACDDFRRDGSDKAGASEAFSQSRSKFVASVASIGNIRSEGFLKDSSPESHDVVASTSAASPMENSSASTFSTKNLPQDDQTKLISEPGQQELLSSYINLPKSEREGSDQNGGLSVKPSEGERMDPRHSPGASRTTSSSQSPIHLVNGKKDDGKKIVIRKVEFPRLNE